MAGYILLLVFSLSVICHANNPGIRFRISEKALNSGVQRVVKKLTDEVKIYTLPAVSGGSRFGEDDIQYLLTDMTIVRFDYAKVEASFVPQIGIKITLQGGSVQIKCNWVLQSFFLNDSGSAELTLDGVLISLVLKVYRSDPGVPSVSMLDCQSFVPTVDVNMQSGISFIYDHLKEPIAEMVRTRVYEQLCPALQIQVHKWNMSLMNLKLNFALTRMIDTDWSLISEPEISKQYADLHFKGQFNLHGEKNGTFSPGLMVFPVQSMSRTYVGISETSLNSFLNAYHKNGSLNLMLSEVLESRNLTTSELATITPEISQQYKTPAPLNISLSVIGSPNVHLKTNNTTMAISAFLHVFAITNEAKNELLFGSKILMTLNVNMSASDGIEFEGLNIIASINLNRLQADKSDPSPKAPKDVPLDQALQQVFSQLVCPLINEKLEKGISIPTQFQKNPSVSIEENYALMKADMKWKFFNNI